MSSSTAYERSVTPPNPDPPYPTDTKCLLLRDVYTVSDGSHDVEIRRGEEIIITEVVQLIRTNRTEPLTSQNAGYRVKAVLGKHKWVNGPTIETARVPHKYLGQESGKSHYPSTKVHEQGTVLVLLQDFIYPVRGGQRTVPKGSRVKTMKPAETSTGTKTTTTGIAVYKVLVMEWKMKPTEYLGMRGDYLRHRDLVLMN